MSPPVPVPHDLTGVCQGALVAWLRSEWTRYQSAVRRRQYGRRLDQVDLTAEVTAHQEAIERLLRALERTTEVPRAY